MNYTELVQRQRAFYRKGATRSLESRRAALLNLKSVILDAIPELTDAMKADLGKPEFEIVASEMGSVLREIRTTHRSLRRLTRPQRVNTPFILRPGRSRVEREPFGSVLVVGPWNYPFHLSMLPAVGALAAGNTVVVKPSEYAPTVAAVMEKYINAAFSPELLTVVTGDSDTAQGLTEAPFDFIFFTGSTGVGQKVYEAAARRLVPVTLELGGKNPCIVHRDANLTVAAQRLTWGKFFNAGQTCVAPDTVFCHEEVKDQLVENLSSVIVRYYGENPRESTDFGRIVNTNHFDRLAGLLSQGRVITGGDHDRSSRYIQPTIMDEVKSNSSLETEEVFGPLLPIVTYSTVDELYEKLQFCSTPLALYVFTRNQELISEIRNREQCGTLVINDVFAQIVNPSLPFGGVGTSGLGSYRGREMIRTFTRPMGVYRRPAGFDPSLRYPPNSEPALRMVKKLFYR
jgi:aldehyde dehydrogenase (NAD+)